MYKKFLFEEIPGRGCSRPICLLCGIEAPANDCQKKEYLAWMIHTLCEHTEQLDLLGLDIDWFQKDILLTLKEGEIDQEKFKLPNTIYSYRKYYLDYVSLLDKKDFSTGLVNQFRKEIKDFSEI